MLKIVAYGSELKQEKYR